MARMSCLTCLPGAHRRKSWPCAAADCHPGRYGYQSGERAGGFSPKSGITPESSSCRRRCRNCQQPPCGMPSLGGADIEAYVPERVASLIARHVCLDTIRNSRGRTGHLQQLADYECQLRPYLNTRRLLHSLNVMRYAMHSGPPPQPVRGKAGTAGLLHDCAKCLEAHKVLAFRRLAGDPQLLEPDAGHGRRGPIGPPRIWHRRRGNPAGDSLSSQPVPAICRRWFFDLCRRQS